jgi:hypothetical protein
MLAAISIMITYRLGTVYMTALSQVSHAVANGRASAMQALAQHIRQIRAARGGDFLVYAPPEARTFWDIGTKCRAKPFLVPALTGVAMLRGLPPADQGCTGKMEYYGYQEYSSSALSVQLTQQEACAEATSLGFQAVLVVRKPYESATNILWECKK